MKKRSLKFVLTILFPFSLISCANGEMPDVVCEYMQQRIEQKKDLRFTYYTCISFEKDANIILEYEANYNKYNSDGILVAGRDYFAVKNDTIYDISQGEFESRKSDIYILNRLKGDIYFSSL